MIGYHQGIHESDESGFVTDDERRDAENQGAMHHHEYRHVNTRWDEHGCLQINARLTPEQGALVIKAIEAAVESIAQTEPAENSESHALEVTKDPREYCNGYGIAGEIFSFDGGTIDDLIAMVRQNTRY